MVSFSQEKDSLKFGHLESKSSDEMFGEISVVPVSCWTIHFRDQGILMLSGGGGGVDH